MSIATKNFKIAIVGNPNSGKSSLFNILTGLNQKTGNYSGITVDRKTANISLSNDISASITDLPGIYSFYGGTSQDERLVTSIFASESNDLPDLLIYVADLNALEKHFLFFTQLYDLGIPIALAINMMDTAEQNGVRCDIDTLSKELGVPVIRISTRTKEGIDTLKSEIVKSNKNLKNIIHRKTYSPSEIEQQVAGKINNKLNLRNKYRALMIAHHFNWLPNLKDEDRCYIQNINKFGGFKSLDYQVRETMARYDYFTPIFKRTISQKGQSASATKTSKIDSVLTHPLKGSLIFIFLMMLMFMSVFWLAQPFMGFIEEGFSSLGEFAENNIPIEWLKSFVVNALIAGVGNVMVFIPQIAILFFFLAVFEESGYMSRVVYLLDGIMAKIGLNGRSFLALISGFACAIPAIMSARTISNKKEKLITILVTPFVSCSARIPVFILLIGIIVPNNLTYQILVFSSMYLLGLMGTLIAAWVLQKYLNLNSSDNSCLLLELPHYRPPIVRNVMLMVWAKTKTFIIKAGTIIFFATGILWGLLYFGPQDISFKDIQNTEYYSKINAENEEMNDSIRLNNSFGAYLGKFIEPIIEPLGYDWKLGIGVIGSFAAREVFVSTIGLVFGLGEVDGPSKHKTAPKNPVYIKMQEEGYSKATCASLLVFFVFAIQCISTLAVVRRETNSWKWPVVQLIFMTTIAYVLSFFTYQSLTLIGF